jgi:hypothetical protein
MSLATFTSTMSAHYGQQSDGRYQAAAAVAEETANWQAQRFVCRTGAGSRGLATPPKPSYGARAQPPRPSFLARRTSSSLSSSSVTTPPSSACTPPLTPRIVSADGSWRHDPYGAVPVLSL